MPDNEREYPDKETVRAKVTGQRRSRRLRPVEDIDARVLDRRVREQRDWFEANESPFADGDPTPPLT